MSPKFNRRMVTPFLLVVGFSFALGCGDNPASPTPDNERPPIDSDSPKLTDENPASDALYGLWEITNFPNDEEAGVLRTRKLRIQKEMIDVSTRCQSGNFSRVISVGKSFVQYSASEIVVTEDIYSKGDVREYTCEASLPKARYVYELKSKDEILLNDPRFEAPLSLRRIQEVR